LENKKEQVLRRIIKSQEEYIKDLEDKNQELKEGLLKQSAS